MTGYDDRNWGQADFWERSPWLSVEAAEYIASMQPALIGLDFQTEEPGSRAKPISDQGQRIADEVIERWPVDARAPGHHVVRGFDLGRVVGEQLQAGKAAAAIGRRRPHLFDGELGNQAAGNLGIPRTARRTGPRSPAWPRSAKSSPGNAVTRYSSDQRSRAGWVRASARAELPPDPARASEPQGSGSSWASHNQQPGPVAQLVRAADS
jgi:hypothetical protein